MAVNERNEIVQPYETGQRLYCRVCNAEIEVVSPCTADRPDQGFRCCGESMQPNIGTKPHINSFA